MAAYIDWPARAGTYRYWFLKSPSNGSSIQNVGGNYMFVKLTPDGYVPVYVGIADDLGVRIPCHERWADAVRAGATAVMAHTQPNAAIRAAEERDLIAHWHPPLNSQHRVATGLLRGLGS